MPTILVADDNSNIQKMVTLALKDAGISVVAVGNGDAAIKKLPDVHPDLVLADIFMPVKNGYEVCEFMKADERFAHIPVVLLVGAFDPLDEHEVERVHADGVLKKPFVPPDPLLAMVKSLLEKAAAGLAAGHASALSEVIAASEARTSPRLEKTQQLTAEELASATRGGAVDPEPDPEPEQFGSQPAALAIDEAHSPLAFGDMLDAEAAPTEEGEDAGEESDEESDEEAAAEPSFEASSVSDYHFAGATHGSSAAGSAEAHSAIAGESAETAPETAEDHWGGIKEEMKHPDPVEPPIPVDFGDSAPMEIISDQSRESLAAVEVRPDPSLVSSAHDWVSAPPPIAAPPPVEIASGHESEFEPMRIEVDSPSRTAARDVDDTQTFSVHHAPGKPLESIAQDLHEDARLAALPLRDVEETQQFRAPSASVTPPPIAPAAPHSSSWGRVEEVMLPAAPIIAGAVASMHTHRESHSPDAPAPEPVHVESQHDHPARDSSAAPVSSGTGTGSDLLIEAITRKVMEKLDAKTIEMLAQELVRPLIEALVRREVDKE